MTADQLGRIVVLNGVPRSGKSSIAAAIQQQFAGVWLNLGVDLVMRMTPEQYRPGLGLRPGGERPDLEPLVVAQYRALYDAIAAHSRQGLNVVADVGHHDAYSRPLGILPDCARRLDGLPALFVGVRCPPEVVLERRRATWGDDGDDMNAVMERLRRWQEAVHSPGIYDLEVDTAVLTPEECAEAIQQRMHGNPPTAYMHLAALSPA